MNIVVALALYKPLGIGGIVIGTTVSNGVMMVLLATRLRRRLGGLEIARTLRATAVMLAAGALLAAVTYGVWCVLDRALGESLIAQLIAVGLALALGAAAYAAAVIAAGVPEARQIADLHHAAPAALISATPHATATAPAARRPVTRSRPLSASQATAMTTLVSRTAATAAAGASFSAASVSP